MEPVISVIVAIFNVENYIERCVDSICSQTYTSLEIILVDDGSTDRSGEICDRYAREDSRIRVIHKKNGGLSDARNAGLDSAKGDYIAFVDGDDYIDGEMYAKMYRCLRNTGTDLCMSAIWEVDERGNQREAYINDFENCSIFPREEAMHLLASITQISTCAWNKLYRRELFDGIRFPKGRNYEDKSIMHEIFMSCDSISLEKDAVYYYWQRQDSITNRKYSHANLQEIEAGEKKEKFYEEHFPQYLVDVRANMALRAMQLHMFAMRSGAAREDLSVIRTTIRRTLTSFLRSTAYSVQLKWSTLFRYYGNMAKYHNKTREIH